MKIIANCLIKNEERFVWYAVNSVINYVDEILVWDTGSSDKTVEIIKSINNPKIKFEEKGPQSPAGLTRLRQEMLDKSDCDWIMILDGDDIWYQNTVNDIKSQIFNTTYDLIVSPTIMLIGDIYHYQEEKAGKYKIGKVKGHYNIRFIRRGIPGLHLEGIYPNESYVDESGVKIQNLPREKILFTTQPYLHASYLRDQTYHKSGIKYELGIPFEHDFYYPEALFWPRPSFVPTPWVKTDLKYKIRAFFETPPKKIKRRII